MLNELTVTEKPLKKRLIQKEATRELIFRTAFAVYAARGFGAPTSLIARKAGVSHGSVFAHFPSREELLVCLLRFFQNAITGRLHELALRRSGIRDMLYAHLSALEDYEDFYTRLVSEAPLLPAEARDTLIGIQSTVSIHFYDVIRRHQKKHLIKNISPRLVFNTWLGLVHYYLQNRAVFTPGASVLRNRGTELVSTFLALLRK